MDIAENHRSTDFSYDTRGQSAGHDHHCIEHIEHLQHAGIHLPRVLARFLSFCLSHTHLNSELMKNVVASIVKDKTVDTFPCYYYYQCAGQFA